MLIMIRVIILIHDIAEAGRYKTCPTMTLPKIMVIDDFRVNLDFSCDCVTYSIIYISRCINCLGKPDRNHYIGQSVNSFRTRNNGHRNKFKISEFDKSALSHHTYVEHIDTFPNKLLNYSFGVIKQSSPQHLNRD